MSFPSDEEILRVAKSDDWVMRKIWDRLTEEKQQIEKDKQEQLRRTKLDEIAQRISAEPILSVSVSDYGGEIIPAKLLIKKGLTEVIVERPVLRK